MICPNCKCEVLPGTKFCGACGTMLPAEPVAPVVAEPVFAPMESLAAEPEATVVEVPAMEPPTTVYCPKCAQGNRIGDRFCMKCGNDLTGVPASYEAPAIAAKANTLDQVGDFAKESAEKASALAKKGAKEAKKLAKKGAEEAKKLATEGAKHAKKLPKPLLIAGIALIAVIVIIAAILILPAIFGDKGNNNILYFKDMEMVYSAGKGEPMEVTTRLVDDGDVEKEDLAEANYVIAAYTTYAADGGVLFFPDKVGSGDGFTIYYRDLNKPKKEAEKLDSEIVYYAVAESGKEVIYMKGGEEGNLYRSNLKDKEKIASDVVSFYVTADLKTVIYLNADGNLYVQNKGKDKEKIAGDISAIEYVSEDLGVVYYEKEDTLYVQEVGKDRVKIAEEVVNVINILDSGEVYYITGFEEEVKLADFVVDDMAAKDEAMVEPEYPSYWDYDDDEAYDQAYAEYEAATEEYWNKQNRDWIREDLENYTETISSYTLCYFDGKESVEVMPNLTESWPLDYALDAAVVAVKATEDAGELKVKLSEIQSAWDVSNKLYEARNTEATNYVVIGTTPVALQTEEAIQMTISNDGKSLHYLEYYTKTEKVGGDVPVEEGYDYEPATYTVIENEGDLYEVAIKKGSLGEPKKVDEEVYYSGLSYLSDGRIRYFKNADEEKSTGDLFVNGKEVDYDVYLYNVRYTEDLGGILYFTDWSDKDEEGTLKLWKGKKGEKISDDVSQIVITSAGDMYYMYDYSWKSCTGSLYLYNGSKSVKIDDDVIAIVSGGKAGTVRGYGW